MDVWAKIIDKAFDFGGYAALVFIIIGGIGFAVYKISRFFAPMITAAFVEHTGYINTTTETMKKIGESVVIQEKASIAHEVINVEKHNRTHIILARYADIILTLAPPEKLAEVRSHVEQIKKALE